MQGDDAGDEGEGGEEPGPTGLEYVELYRAKAGTVQEVIGAELRAQAAAGEVVNDPMARLKNALISEEEFLRYMAGRGGQEATQVRPHRCI